MKTLFLPIVFALATFARAEVKTEIAVITDNRTTGEFFAGLELKLVISGPELADAKGMRLKVESAKDDTGKDFLAGGSRSPFADDFEPLKVPFGSSDEDKKAGRYDAEIKIGNPARAAKTATITGFFELLSPKSDPASVITFNPRKDAGKVLTQPALKKAGVQLTPTAPKNSEVGFVLIDPKGIVANVEYCSADGKPLEVSGRSVSGFNGQKTFDISLNAELPPNAIAKIYLLTEKSVVRVPLKLEAIALP